MKDVLGRIKAHITAARRNQNGHWIPARVYPMDLQALVNRLEDLERERETIRLARPFDRRKVGAILQPLLMSGLDGSPPDGDLERAIKAIGTCDYILPGEPS